MGGFIYFYDKSIYSILYNPNWEMKEFVYHLPGRPSMQEEGLFFTVVDGQSTSCFGTIS